MKKRKKIKLSYSKERVLFSDVLPYECPIIFSNRYLYRFLAKYLWIGKEKKVNSITYNVLEQKKRLNEKDANAFAALLFVAQVLINKVKSKCCGIKVKNISIRYSIFAIKVNSLFANLTKSHNTFTIETDYIVNYWDMRVIKLNCSSMNMRT